MNKSYAVVIILIVLVAGGLLLKKIHTSQVPVSPVSVGNTGATNDIGAMPSTSGKPSDTMGATAISADVVVPTTVTATAQVKEFTVIGQNFRFIPDTLEVNKGDKVRITFKNVSGMHNFVIDEFAVTSKTTTSPDQEVLEFTATKSGTFEYYCSVGTHRAMGMVGTLKVN